MKTPSFPSCKTLSEIKRIVNNASHNFPHCRKGQAVVNTYHLDKKIEDAIYELDDAILVALIIHRQSS